MVGQCVSRLANWQAELECQKMDAGFIANYIRSQSSVPLSIVTYNAERAARSGYKRDPYIFAQKCQLRNKACSQSMITMGHCSKMGIDTVKPTEDEG